MPYGYYGFYWMDYTYILVVIGAIICLIASARMNSTFNRYQRVRSMSGMTGAMAAERILRDAGIHDVQVQHISGNLTDHYNPMNKTLSLSDSVYNSTSIAAVGVAAHECGHAIQHAKGYVPLRVRGAFVPVANIGSNLAWPLIIIGLFIRGSMSSVLIQAGIIMFSLAVLFQHQDTVSGLHTDFMFCHNCQFSRCMFRSLVFYRSCPDPQCFPMEISICTWPWI